MKWAEGKKMEATATPIFVLRRHHESIPEEYEEYVITRTSLSISTRAGFFALYIDYIIVVRERKDLVQYGTLLWLLAGLICTSAHTSTTRRDQYKTNKWKCYYSKRPKDLVSTHISRYHMHVKLIYLWSHEESSKSLGNVVMSGRFRAVSISTGLRHLLPSKPGLNY